MGLAVPPPVILGNIVDSLLCSDENGTQVIEFLRVALCLASLFCHNLFGIVSQCYAGSEAELLGSHGRSGEGRSAVPRRKQGRGRRARTLHGSDARVRQYFGSFGVWCIVIKVRFVYNSF